VVSSVVVDDSSRSTLAYILAKRIHEDMTEEPDERCGYIHQQSQCDDHSNLEHLLVIARNVDESAAERRRAAVAPNLLKHIRIVMPKNKN